MGFLDDDNDEYDSFIAMQMTASSRQEAIDLTGDDTFYMGNDSLEDEDDNFWKSQLIDEYGLDEYDLEDLDEVDCEEIYDKLSGSSGSYHRSSTGYSPLYSVAARTKTTSTNPSVTKEETSHQPKKKGWSFGKCLGIGFAVCWVLCILAGGDISSGLITFILFGVAIVAYLYKNTD